MPTVFDVHGVDFLGGHGSIWFNTLSLKSPRHRFLGENININEIKEIEAVTSHTTKDVESSVGMGALGALAFGVPGLIGGVLLGKSKGKVSFVARFKDGRILVATADSKVYGKLLAAAVRNQKSGGSSAPQIPNGSRSQVTKACPYCAETIKFEAKKCRFCGEFLSEIEYHIPADERILCEDGNCIGIIGKDGKCTRCGKSLTKNN